VDYVRPIEAIVPGVQGRVLGVLSRTSSELTIRTVARLAGVSGNRATAVLNRLVSLGVVQRREVGSAALVALARDNEAARTVLALADLRDGVLAQFRAAARDIDPTPACLVVFGSFARGEAREGSDVDVLVVRPAGVDDDDPRWIDSLGRWADHAGRIAGNPVNQLHAAVEDLPRLLGRPDSVWQKAAEDGVLIAGVPLREASSSR
jgi:hypothetical protein